VELSAWDRDERAQESMGGTTRVECVHSDAVVRPFRPDPVAVLADGMQGHVVP
jgi:hypothetical protein